MAKIETEIKNTIASHLRRAMFGMEIYGRHEIGTFDGKQDGVMVIEVYAATRFECYGVVRAYHPEHGKWQAALLSEHHCGKPVQVFTADEIRAEIARVPSEDFIYKIFGGEKPNTPPAVWNPYWECSADPPPCEGCGGEASIEQRDEDAGDSAEESGEDRTMNRPIRVGDTVVTIDEHETGVVREIGVYFGSILEFYIEFTDRFETYTSDDVALAREPDGDEQSM